MKYIFLMISIIFETIGTTALKYSEQFTRLIPSLIALVSYGLCFYFLSIVLKVLPVGLVYGIWSGVGIILVTLVGIFLFRQVPDVPAIIGIILIIVGVIILNLLSKMSKH
ncbi:MAG: multidrug efflux SMR transporter [Flavobacteriales bacterium]